MMRRVSLFAVLGVAFFSACASAPPPVNLRQWSGPSLADEEMVRLLGQLQHNLALTVSHIPLDADEEEEQAAAAMATMTARVSPMPSIRYPGSPIVIPVAGVPFSRIGRTYGDPRSGGRSHQGLDIFAPRGTPVVASMDGTVTYIGTQRRGGRCLWLSTDFGRAFYYAHLERWAKDLKQGDRVTRGTVLGYVGTTGNAAHSKPHLHFQIQEGNDDVDPWFILAGATTVPVKPILSGGFGRR